MDDLQPGDLLFLTANYDKYVRGKHKDLKIVLTNRLAKLEEIIDWSSPKGKIIKEAREKNGKWENLPIEECKYLITIYYHDLNGRKGQPGVTERCIPLFRNHPRTNEPFFHKVPDWVYKDIISKCQSFEVQLKET
jgi:hypothetical protein